jgi:hypothetical protein
MCTVQHNNLRKSENSVQLPICDMKAAGYSAICVILIQTCNLLASSSSV